MKIKIVSSFLALLMLFVPLTYAAGLEPKVLRVGVVVAPSFKTIANWKSEFERRLSYASKVFETEFKIKFTPIAYVDWENPKEANDMVYLLEDLKQQMPLGKVDLVIGLTWLTQIKDPEQIKELHVIGQARPFSGYLVLRYPHNRLFKAQEDTVLVHELGHLFGAVHTSQANTIMSPVVDRQIPSRFDDSNREIIMLTRDMNFKEGMAKVDTQKLQFLVDTYLKLIRTEQPADFFYALGIFYLNLNEPEKALKTWKKAASMDHTNPMMLLDLGILYSRMGKSAEAIKVLSHASANFKKNEQPHNEAYALNMLGGAYLEQKNLTGAYSAWSRAAILEPEDLDIRTNLAIILIKKKQYDNAARELLRILKVEPENVKALSQLGIAYYRLDRLEDSEKYLTQAHKLIGKIKHPTTNDNAQKIQIYNYLGNLLMKKKETDQALKYYRAACALDETTACAKKLGQIYYQLQKWDESASSLSRVLQKEKDDPDVYGMLGSALMRKGDTETALTVFREGARYAKDAVTEAEFYKNTGSILLNLRRLDLAEKEFQVSVIKNWNNPESHMGLALCQVGLNRFPEALQSLKNVLRLDPKNQKAKEMVSNIELALQSTPFS